ncbi:MAG: serine/threonine-protein kinase [Deltaproteobacteria bacterium]|nr:serine/threonine-protein kinase [Myxococcales bacterium]MDP3214795.1 serine/threonine-protein kinase [Deltaproteobacteria bacterium]
MQPTNEAIAHASDDEVVHYLLPHPIAAFFHLTRISHLSGDRLGFRFRFVEETLRFLALLAVSDALARGADKRQARTWFKAFETPSLGKLLKALQSAARRSDQPFVPELRGALGGPWESATISLIGTRNDWAHGRVPPTEASARKILPTLDEPWREFTRGLTWLQRYQLGAFAEVRSSGDTFRALWFASRGMEETCESVSLRCQRKPREHEVAILDIRSGNLLYLTPFFYVDSAERGRSKELHWLRELTPSDGQHLVTYQTVAAAAAQMCGFFDPGSDERPTLAQLLERPGSWPQQVSGMLSVESASALEAPTASPSIDQRLRVIGKLGEGGMGEVWEVHDADLDRRCALKILRSLHNSSPSMLKRFHREGRLLAKVRHPGVVQVFDRGVNAKRQPFLLMELVEGENLQQRLERAGPLPEAEAISVVIDLLDALAAIHAVEVVHRDVNPRNVMLSSRGEVRVLDLGIALHNVETRGTRTNEVLGTRGYIAPEQYSGDATPRSDIFAAGHLLRTLCTGRAPDDVENPLEDLSPALRDVYARAVAKNPSDRFVSAEEFCNTLRHISALPRSITPPEAVTNQRPTATIGSEDITRVHDFSSLEVDVLDNNEIAVSGDDNVFHSSTETAQSKADSLFAQAELFIRRRLLIWARRRVKDAIAVDPKNAAVLQRARDLYVLIDDPDGVARDTDAHAIHAEAGGKAPSPRPSPVVPENVPARHSALEGTDPGLFLEEVLDDVDHMIERGMSDGATDVLIRLLEVYPGHPKLLDRWEETTQKIDSGVKISAQPTIDHDPSTPSPSTEDCDTHYDLGIAYRGMGLIDGAIAEFRLASASPARRSGSALMLGVCHVDKGEFGAAISYFREALAAPHRTQDEDRALYYEIGNVYEKMGDVSEAIYYFERVEKSDRSSSFRDTRDRLLSLKREVKPTRSPARNKP